MITMPRSPATATATSTAPSFALILALAGPLGCMPQPGEPDPMVVLTETESESDGTTGDDSGPTTLMTTTSTVTGEPATISTTDGGDTEDTAGDTEDTEGTTGAPGTCNYNGYCNPTETIESCLHDCATCDMNGYCDKKRETPGSCPSDCPATQCDLNGVLDPLTEQCDDGGDPHPECTHKCNLNVCGDGVLFPKEDGGAEECDDGNTKDNDGCSKTCIREKRYVFVSSIAMTGDFAPKSANLEGVALADHHCQKLALAAALPGTYRAWLSDGMTEPLPRFGWNIEYPARFVLADNTTIAEGWAELTSGTLQQKIWRDETAYPLHDVIVWTNTKADGKRRSMDIDCNSWRSKSSNDWGYYGHSAKSDGSWTDSGNQVPCSVPSHLYCFQTEP